MISQTDLAKILVDHHGVSAGELEADLLAGMIIDEYQRNNNNRSLKDCVDAARSGYPGFFRGAPAAPESVLAASSGDDPWAHAPVTRRVMREAGRK